MEFKLLYSKLLVKIYNSWRSPSVQAQVLMNEKKIKINKNFVVIIEFKKIFEELHRPGPWLSIERNIWLQTRTQLTIRIVFAKVYLLDKKIDDLLEKWSGEAADVLAKIFSWLVRAWYRKWLRAKRSPFKDKRLSWGAAG